MKENNLAKVVPQEDPETKIQREVFSGGLTSGYFARSGKVLPKQGDQWPWKGGVNYLKDLFNMTFGGVSKDSLYFETEDKKKQ